MALNSAHPHPKVSVAILTRNAGKLFEQVLDALHAQKTDWPFEIVVLDSASRDGTDKLAEQRGAKVIPYRPTKFRFGTARDTVFSHCRGDVIVTISHDVVPATETWLADLVAPILEDRVLQVKLYEGGYRMMQVKGALSYHGHDYTWKDLSSRTGSFALGWARLGWPYTFGRLVRDLVQPSRHLIMLNALVRGRLVSWKEVVYPVAMCFIQYKWSRRHKAEPAAAAVATTNAAAWQGAKPPPAAVATTK